MRLLLALILLTGCQSHHSFIDPEFVYYYNSFVQDAAKHNHQLDLNDLTMVFYDNLNPDVAGVCKINYNNKVIMIKKHFWDQYPELVKKWIIYHELAHCTMYQKHRSTGIMQPYLVYDTSYIQQNWEDLLTELFNN